MTKFPNFNFKRLIYSEMLTYIMFFFLGAIILAKLFAIDQFYYVIFGDRDISRASMLGHHFFVSGSELQNQDGARNPGGALYYFLYIIMKINDSVLFIYAVTYILTLVSSLLLFDLGRRLENKLAGAIATVCFLSSGDVNSVINTLYNPLFGVPFLVGGFYYASRFFWNSIKATRKRSWHPL